MYWLCYHIHTYKKTQVFYFHTVFSYHYTRSSLNVKICSLWKSTILIYVLCLTGCSCSRNFNGRRCIIDGPDEVLSCNWKNCVYIVILLTFCVHKSVLSSFNLTFFHLSVTELICWIFCMVCFWMLVLRSLQHQKQVLGFMWTVVYHTYFPISLAIWVRMTYQSRYRFVFGFVLVLFLEAYLRLCCHSLQGNI